MAGGVVDKDHRLRFAGERLCLRHLVVDDGSSADSTADIVPRQARAQS